MDNRFNNPRNAGFVVYDQKAVRGYHPALSVLHQTMLARRWQQAKTSQKFGRPAGWNA
jgi:hypothetical protein